MENNLKYYEILKEVPQNAQKPITGGRLKGKTNINPMWRIKMLTETFGACGIGWYTKTVEKWTEEGANGETTAHVDILLFVKINDEWSQGIEGTGGSMLIEKESRGMHTNDEAYKMAYTDALSVACKSLGMGADIYWNEDKTKYDKEPVKTTKDLQNDLERQTMLERIQIMVEEQGKQEWLKGIIGDNPLENYGTDSVRKIYKQLGGK